MDICVYVYLLWLHVHVRVNVDTQIAQYMVIDCTLLHNRFACVYDRSDEVH